MDEGFELYLGHEGVNLGNFFKRQFAREYDPARALLLPELYCVLICYVCLRGDVHG